MDARRACIFALHAAAKWRLKQKFLFSSSQKNSRSKPSVVRKTLATKTKAGDSGKADSAPPRKPGERVEKNSDVGWNGRVIVATKDVAWEEVGTARWRIARRIALNEVTARQSLDAGNKFPLNSVTTSSEAKEGFFLPKSDAKNRKDSISPYATLNVCSAKETADFLAQFSLAFPVLSTKLLALHAPLSKGALREREKLLSTKRTRGKKSRKVYFIT